MKVEGGGVPRKVVLPSPYDLVWSGISLVFFAGGLLYPLIHGMVGSLLPACHFKSIIGIPCVGCGSSRSLIAFSHGGILEAFRMNPLFGGLCFFSLLVIGYTLLVRVCRVPRLDLPPTGGWVYSVAIPSLILLNWAFLVFAGR